MPKPVQLTVSPGSASLAVRPLPKARRPLLKARRPLLSLLLWLGVALALAGGAGAQTSTISTPQITSFSAIPNCALVLDANQSVYTNTAKTTYAQNEGDAVACWADTSGLGNDAVQAAAANQPTLHLNALGNPYSGVSSRAIRLGTGANSLVSGLSVTSGSFTVIALYQETSAPGGFARVVQGSNNWLIGPGGNSASLYGGSPGSTFPAGQVYAAPGYTLQTVTQTASVVTNQAWPYPAATGTTGAYPGTFSVGAGGSGNAADSDIEFLAVYTRALTPAELSQVYDLLGRRLGFVGTQFVVYGNSFTYGYNDAFVNPAQVGFAYKALAGLQQRGQTPPFTLIKGTTGISSANLLGNAVSVVDMQTWPTLPATGRRIINLWEITNDINNQAAPASGQAAYNNFVALCQHFKSNGWTVIIEDCLPRGQFTAAQEAARQQANSLLAADFAGGAKPAYADYLIKTSLDTAITGNIDADQIHPNPAGYQAAANDLLAVLTPLLPTPYVPQISYQPRRGR